MREPARQGDLAGAAAGVLASDPRWREVVGGAPAAGEVRRQVPVETGAAGDEEARHLVFVLHREQAEIAVGNGGG